MSRLGRSYPYVIEQELLWRDMDAYQHVNNAVYFRYFEDVRMAFFEEVGVVRLKNETQVGPILASTRCDYRAPLTFPDRIEIGTCIEDIRPKRFTMHYAVFSTGMEAIAAEGAGTLVFYDYDAGRSCEIPDVVRDKLESMQRKS